MVKNFKISEFLDVYGQLLSKRQRQIAEDYYNFDLSLAEIAENYGITRQAVCDALKSAEKSLLKYEKILNLVELKKGIRAAVSADEEQRLRIIKELNSL